MGNWITPKVVIEKFAPNQYVAVCSVEVPSNLLYVDIATGWGGYYEIGGYGTPDRYHQFAETINNKNGKTIRFESTSLLDFDSPDPGWYRNVPFYSDYRRALIPPTRIYEYSGATQSYDIEVYQSGNNWYADVYITGTADAAASGKSPSNHS